MDNTHKILADKLLHISAIKIQPEMPFVWGSGWNSPIYTDNRIALSNPAVRTFIKIEFARLILEKYPDATAIAGVATGAIAIGALVADVLNLPYVYVRSEPKDHGLENQIEGNLKFGSKTVIVEDQISTGAASLKAAQAVEGAGGEVLGMCCIFNYQFPAAQARFEEAGIPLQSLLTFSETVEVAQKQNILTADGLAILREWHKEPAEWLPRQNPGM